MHRHKTFFACGSTAPVRVELKVAELFGLWGPCGAKCAGTQTASAPGAMTLSGSFFEPLVAEDQKASLASLSP